MVESTVMALKSDFVDNFGGYKYANKPICTHCGKSGHTMKKCYRLHDFPFGFKFTKGRPISTHNVTLDQEDHSNSEFSNL